MYANFDPVPQVVGVTRKYRLFKKAYNMFMIHPYPDRLPIEIEMSRYRWKVQRRQLYTVRVFADDLYSRNGYEGQQIGFDYDLFSFDERQSFIRSDGGAL